MILNRLKWSFRSSKLHKRLLKYKDDPATITPLRAYYLKVTSREQWYKNYHVWIENYLNSKENNNGNQEKTTSTVHSSDER